LRPVLVKTETIDQRVLPGQSKDARLRISRLRFRSDGSDLDEAEPQRCPRRKGNAVLIQSSRKSDWIWKVQAEECFRFRWRLKRSEHAQGEIEMRSRAKQLNGETMCGLRFQRKEKWPDKSLVKVHWCSIVITLVFENGRVPNASPARTGRALSRLICRCKTD